MPVGDEPFKPPYADGFPVFTPYAFCLTLGFLGANPPADGGKGVGLLYDFIGFLIVAFGDFFYKLRDSYVNGTAL